MRKVTRCGSNGAKPAGTRLRWGAWVLLLLVAAGLRLAWLPQFPPGIEHDEVAEVLIADGILRGQHALFFRQAYGQEPLFLYLLAGAMTLMGRSVLSLRFVAAAVGVLTVASGARLARTLFGERVALVTAAGLAVMLWPVFWSRVGLRGMLLPLTMCWAADALWRSLYGRRHSQRWAMLSGVGWGAAMYTYSASRAVPLLLAGLGAYWVVRERALLRRRWRELALILGVTVLVAAPLWGYLLRHPEVQTRVHEVQAPLIELRAGNFAPVLHNAVAVAGMFNLRGDATARNNFPLRPVFPDPVWGGLFVLGGAFALFHLREARYWLVVLWLGVMLSPTVVTTDAPNFVRALGALPVVMMFPGLGAAWLWRKDRSRRWVTVMLAVAFAVNVAWTGWDYFVRWPRLPEVNFVWQGDLRAVAAWLDAHSQVQEVTVAGLSNTSMDEPSLTLLLHRADVRARWCDSGSPLGSGGALVVPAAGGDFLRPNVVPLNPALAQWMTSLPQATSEPWERFTLYRLPSLPLPETDVPFAGGVRWRGITFPADGWHAGETVRLMSFWEAEAGPHPPLKVFLHLVDDAGQIRAQHDGLDCPAAFWQVGDRIVQAHLLALPADLPSGKYLLRLGLYDRETLQPYRPLDGREFITVGAVDVH